MAVRVFDRIQDIAPAAWNALSGTDHPFLQHEFLAALEASGSVATDTGWQPQHLTVWETGADGDRLSGAVPLYRKQHSYGEYIFDWAWANAYARAGLAYYPKLVAAVPFTPATGARLLVHPRAETLGTRIALIDAALALAQDTGASSLHWLFTRGEEAALLETRGHLRRVTSQFHWHNRDYRDFDDYLAMFAADKRKKIKRERRFVREAGVTLRVVPGSELDESDWRRFFEFYRTTTRKHGAIAYLNLDFFLRLGASMPANIVMIFAYRDDAVVAGALNFQGPDCLYGRYWGALADFHSLHFETCYYRPIEYCIEHGLARFEAGAQGEHKLARGLLPIETYSAHWLQHPQFARAVADFLAREQAGMEYYIDELKQHSPFKKDCP